MAVPMYHIDAPVVDELPFDIFDLASIHPSSYVTLQEFRSRIKKLALKLHPDKATTTGLGIHQPPANGAYPSMTVLTAILDYFKHRSDWSFGEHRYFWDMHTRSTMNSQAILDGVADPRIIFSPAPNWPESERPYFMPPTTQQIKDGVVSELLKPITAEGSKLFPKPSTWNQTNNPVYNALAAKRQAKAAEAAAAAADRATDNLKRKRQTPADDRSSTSKKPRTTGPNLGRENRGQSAPQGHNRDDAIEIDSSDDDERSAGRPRRRPPMSRPTTSSVGTNSRTWKPSSDTKPRFDQAKYHLPRRVPLGHSYGRYLFSSGSPFYGMHQPFCYYREDDNLLHASTDNNKTAPLYSVSVQVGYLTLTLDRRQRQCVVYARYSVAASFLLHWDLRDIHGQVITTKSKKSRQRSAMFWQVTLTGHFCDASEDVVRWIVWHLQPVEWQMAVAERCKFQHRPPKGYSGY